MPRRLDAEEVRRQLADLPGWSGDTAAVQREAQARDFATAIHIVGEVAEVAEQMNHHPDIDIRWRRLAFRLHTCVAGGVTQYDIELAHRIAEILEESGAD